MQLSAWTSSTEKTVIAASDAPQALPELSNEASSVAASKGFQQITGWQVHNILNMFSAEQAIYNALYCFTVYKSGAGRFQYRPLTDGC